MVRDPFEREVDPAAILAALDDDDARTIIRSLEEPMTASELSDTCDIPESTTYRKLDVLTEASLLDELTEVRPDGHHTSRYQVAFEEVRILLEDQEFDVEIERPARTPDERLVDLWNEVRRET